MFGGFSLLVTCAGCVYLVVDSNFIPFGSMKDEARGSCLTLKLLVSRLRYAFQVLQIRSQYLHPGNYGIFKVIQGNTITLARSDEP